MGGPQDFVAHQLLAGKEYARHAEHGHDRKHDVRFKQPPGCSFSVPNYWMRLFAAIFFLISITIDGVDGELARLKMIESDFGGKLDVVTDNVVHAAVFIGLLVGCYRLEYSRAYLYLIPLLLGGFAMCAYATWRAFKIKGEQAALWLDKVDRWSGRDFAYLLVILALVDRLEYFAWGTAFGTYVFALMLIWITGWTESSMKAESL